MKSSYFVDIIRVISAVGPRFRSDDADELMEILKGLYSRVALELNDLGHFTLLSDLEICEFLTVLRDDSIREQILSFIVSQASESRDLSHKSESSEIVRLLGGIIPKVLNLPVHYLVPISRDRISFVQ